MQHATQLSSARGYVRLPDGKSVLMRPRPDKSDVYPLLKELDEKVVKLPFLALGTGFKVPTQSRADYTGITS